MPDRDDLIWFKTTFGHEIKQALSHTPFSIDLLVALAAQETGDVWPVLRNSLGRNEILRLCVGDTLDEDRGRRAFPKTKAQLVAAPQGQQMFEVAHAALVDLAKYVPSFSSVAKQPDKFCHGYGVFQVDLQFFKSDPDFFLLRNWADFSICLNRCLKELSAAMERAGLDSHQSLTDLDQVHTAIAYNCGSFNPAKGLKQGYFDGAQFYGQRIFDLLRLSQTAGTESLPATIAKPEAGKAIISPPTSVADSGNTMRVDPAGGLLPLLREARTNKTSPNSNLVTRLPAGHLVKLVINSKSNKFLHVQTSLNGAFYEGFVASDSLLPVPGNPPIPQLAASPALNDSKIAAVFAPRKPGTITRRTNIADAHSLNEPNQPGRKGSSPGELREELATIIEYLGVDNPKNLRYKPRSGVMFCNIYAHDYCYLAGIYLPRVWWTPDGIESLTGGQVVEPMVGATIDEQRANDLFRWLRSFGQRFGWRQTGTLTKLQTEVNSGSVGLIVARRKEDGRSGHIVAVVPETSEEHAKRDASGAVVACLQSQAGARNFRYGTGKPGWWMSTEFAESAFWIHA